MRIKTEAKYLGFLSCGISKADFLEEEALVWSSGWKTICTARWAICKTISIRTSGRIIKKLVYKLVFRIKK